MKMRITPVLLLALAGAAAGIASAEDGVKLTVADKAPPAELSAELRAQLAPKVYQISDADGVTFEIWLVPGVKVKAIGGTAKETLNNAAEISLLGAMTVSKTAPNDFRDDPIDPGLYVMRLALQPKDGNHMGTAPFDTFAILLPHDRDASLKDARDHDTMVKLAQEGTVAKHPPILSLQPIEKAEGTFPRIEVNAEKEWEFLYLKLPIEAAGAKVDLTVGLVVQGIGEL
jgi:hypothetical protein